MDDRPQHRMVVGVGDRDSERGAKTNTVLSAFNAVVGDLSIHGILKACDVDSIIGQKFVGG